MHRYGWLIGLVALCCAARAADGQISAAESITDNSFLIEEAYNQEPGVVQHILTLDWNVEGSAGPDDRVWLLTFTQEWPLFSQKHQISFSVPYTFQETGGQSDNGVGDIELNYRLQALTETDSRPACAPSFTLIVPTGNEEAGLGNGTVGGSFNLPVSKILNDRWTAHFNGGLTVLPDVDGNDLLNYNIGGSAVYAVSRNFNVLFELVSDWEEEDNGNRPAAVVFSPGFRAAVNFKNGAQLVYGLGAPIGLTGAASDFGLFLYVSFEHAFAR